MNKFLYVAKKKAVEKKNITKKETTIKMIGQR